MKKDKDSWHSRLAIIKQHQVLHGGHAGAVGAVQGDPAFPIVVLVDADAAHMVHVHGQAACFYVPEPTQQARYALNTLSLSTNVATT